jgi:hypothetical protein
MKGVTLLAKAGLATGEEILISAYMFPAVITSHSRIVEIPKYSKTIRAVIKNSHIILEMSVGTIISYPITIK